MRTIIINTLGQELTKNPLFFLPFRQEQLFWLERDLSAIDTCVGEIAAICNDQLKRRDYRLVVLADPVSFCGGEVGLVRQCYQKLILALLNRRLLTPLVGQSDLIPQSVSVVFLVSRQKDGSLGVNSDTVLDWVFDISAQDQPITALSLRRVLPGGNLEYVDVTDLFETALADHQSKLRLRQEAGESPADGLVFSDLRTALSADLTVLQQCGYVPAGSTSRHSLNIRLLEFIPKTTVPQLIWADLQMDLCDYLAGQVRHPNAEATLQLPAHTQEDLERRISRAQKRLKLLLGQNAPQQTYFPLVNQPRPSDTLSLAGTIWADLATKAETLPGVAEAKLHYFDKPNDPRPEGPAEPLKRYWLRVGKEKALFHQLCTRLDSEYNEALVESQQQSILDICAQGFRTWRSKALGQKVPLPPEATLVLQPELDVRKNREALAAAQAECTRVTVERLADYTDLRQEAEVIKARFRKAGRFWAPQEGPTGTMFFQMYSAVLALLFLAQILLPYLGITLGQAALSLDRLVHFLLSILVFAGLYGVGLLVWLRNLCAELHGYSNEMSRLIWESSRRREESIEAAVTAYSTVFPDCMRLSENLRELEYIHSVNEARKAHYQAHLDTLRRANELLQELSTQLQLSDRGYETEPVRLTGGLDFQKPPSHGQNLPYYTLLSDEWGNA